ncbi:aldehyde dehydrogenase family protein [Achromobacter sp. SD115]|uniref:aldehyde dehydrogenase family protein n=1 Tax=Achromobacter sp. SD115 TaxID=2782011 RepID=UPI001A9774B5|nr:aldehyde dehydrogenase family protein [Achromobacter sp. SD115]MBO1011998.1 aldehyde dehydrogenase family protein [Achromobacter sp. SD115]
MEHELSEALGRQRRSFLNAGYPALDVRLDRLRRLANVLDRNRKEIVEAEAADFGGRSRFLSHSADILGGLEIIRHTSGQLGDWMKTQPLDVGDPDVDVQLSFAPLGVVGAMTPWNGPVLISYLALVGILAAGNRAMIKLPELAPATSSLLARELGREFDAAEVLAVQGGADVAAAFSRLQFDHLLFTGSTETGRKVMMEAARNLVPVTLELGGKCPVFVGRSADIDVTAARLAHGKLLFAGQVCVTPDYVLAPRQVAERLAEGILSHAQQLYPSIAGNDDYSAIISDRHCVRLQTLVDDAVAKGASARMLHSAQARLAGSRQFPLTLLLETSASMAVMREEIFGPILPVIGCDSFEEAARYARSLTRPLASYYFGDDPEEIRWLRENFQAGSLTLNDVVSQLFHEQIPFGGVGASGMGRYRGVAGFRTFSNLMPVVTQNAAEAKLEKFRPPYPAG